MFKKDFNHYLLFANLFRYPDASYTEHMENCYEMLSERYPDAAIEFKRFREWVSKTDFNERDELFTKTFHIQAICYLDLGYVLFGEDYKRGEFLANMKREQREANNECGEELPDNLSNVLTLIPLLNDDELRDDLFVRVIIPAIDKMLGEFESSRMALKEKILRKKHKAILLEGIQDGNIYQNALKSLLMVAKEDSKDVVVVEEKQPVTKMDQAFIASCTSSCGISHQPTKSGKL